MVYGKGRLNFLCRPENVFVLVGIVFGIIFIFITPPFQASDEDSHFYRAFHVSEGNITARRYLDKDIAGDYLPKSLVDVVAKLSSNIPFHHENKQKIEDMIDVLNQPLDSSNRTFVRFPVSAWISPVAYIPQGLGIMLGRIFRCSPIVLMYLGRIFNLLFWLILVYRAIKITPVFKWVFLLLALMPMSLFLSASLSADSLTNSLSFLLVALLLRYVFDKDKNIERSDLYILFLLGALLALSKPHIYLLLLFLLIPREKIGSKGKYITIFLSLYLLDIALQGMWCFAIRNLFVRIRTGVETPQQIFFILVYPLQYLFIIIKTLLKYGLFLADSFIGRLGWLDTPLPVFLIVSYYLMLIFVSLLDYEDNISIGYRQKITLLISIFLGTFSIFSLQYIFYTPLGQDTIEGIQGRYFIPLAPIFFLIFYNRKMPACLKRYRPVGVTGYLIFVLAYTVVVLICRYYLDPAFYRPFR